MTLATPREILDFWFKDTPQDRWFATDTALDAAIRNRFEETWRAAREGGFSRWMETMEGALALIVLLDQFPRNMFRGSCEAFATDAMAEVAARDAIARSFDVEAPLGVRCFFYLPLMHSEDLLDQEECVRLTRARLGETHFSFPFARRHCEVVRRFGRFPSRNEPLGRSSTAQEIEFLRANPNGF